MRVLDKYLLSSALSLIPRMPDDPAAPEPEPVAAAALEPAAAPEPAAPEPKPEPIAAAVPEPAKPAMVPLRVMQERVGEETTRRQQAEETARVAIERANSLEEITRRLQAQPKADDPPKPAAVEPARAPTAALANDPVAIARQQLRLEAVTNAGIKEYGNKWDEAVNALSAFDANTVEFVMGVIEVDADKAHQIMFQIAQDGEKAVALARMTPTKRIAEITRMVMSQAAPAAEPKPAEPAKPAAPAISRAPAPKPAVAPHAAAPEVDPRTPEGNDKMTDKEFEAWYKKEYKHGQRRSA